MKKILVITLFVIIVLIVAKNVAKSGKDPVNIIINNGDTYSELENIVDGYTGFGKIESGYKLADTGNFQKYGKFIIPKDFDFYTGAKENSTNTYIDYVNSKDFANKALTFIVRAYSFYELKDDNDLDWCANYYKNQLKNKNQEPVTEEKEVYVNELKTTLLTQALPLENSHLYVWLFKVEGQNAVKCFSIQCKDYDTAIKDKIIASYTFQ